MRILWFPSPLISRSWFLFWSLCYLAFRCLLRLVLLRPRSSEFKELEIVVLRHELSVLQRQAKRPQLTTADRVFVAMLATFGLLLSAIGPVGLAVTTNLNINFLRKGQPGRDVLAAARLLKLGRRLAVGGHAG